MKKEIYVVKDYNSINEQLVKELKLVKDNKLPSYYVLPNSIAINEMQKKYIQSNDDIMFRGGIISFNGLVQEIINDMELPYNILSKSSSIVAITKILNSLHTQNQLKYFHHFNNYEDMANSVLGIIHEIKHYFSKHETLLTNALDIPIKYQDIMKIYHKYYDLLKEHKLFDYQQAITVAAETLKNNDFRGNLLILSGLSYNTLELDFIKQIEKHFNRVVIELQINSSQDFFEREIRLLNYFVSEGYSYIHLQDCNTALNRVIFTNQLSSSDLSMSLTGYNSLSQEVKEVVREVKELLVNGVDINDILVVGVNLEVYSPIFSYYCQESSIPFTAGYNKKLSNTKAVSLVFNILKLVLGNYNVNDLLNLLTSSLEFPQPINAKLLAEFVRVTPTAGNINNWLKACERQKFMASFNNEVMENSTLFTREELTIVEESLRALKDIWGNMPKSGSFKVFTEALIKICKILNLKEVVFNKLFSLNKDIVKDFSLLIKELQQQYIYDFLWPEKMSLQQYFTILKEVTKSANSPMLNNQYKSLKLVNISESLFTRVKHLYVVGFNDGSYPSLGREEWLTNINDVLDNLPVQAKKDKRLSEKLMFSRLLSVSKERISFSYLAKDINGKELLPSPYVADLRSSHKSIKENGVISSILPLSEKVALSENEKMLIKSFGLGLTNNDKIDYRINIEKDRYKDVRNEFNGVINNSEIKADLKSRFGNNATYSTTMLEQYGKCPFSFFVNRVLKVKELETLQIEVSPLIRGNIIHNVLADFLNCYRQETLDSKNIKVYEEELLRILKKETKAVASQLTSEGELWVDIESRRIYVLLKLWLRAEIELQQNSTLRPDKFEYSFRRNESLVLKRDNRLLKIEGYIDRIDTNKDSFAVYDYKSGQASRLQDIKDGVAFQIPLYCEATKNLYPSKRSIGGGYYKIGGDFNRKHGMWIKEYLDDVNLSSRIGDKVSEDNFSEIINDVIEKALKYQTNITSGDFSLAPRRPCPSFCPYQDMCRMNPFLRAIVEAKYNEIH